MSKFELMDPKLQAVADKLKTKVLTGGSGYSINGVDVPQAKIEVRRIIWIEDEIGKAIIIRPEFSLDLVNIDTPQWSFFNLAWLEHGSTNEKKSKPFWIKYLLQNVEFERVEKNIDQLLRSSIENLAVINRKDLK